MDREKSAFWLGLAVLAAGITLLAFVFVSAFGLVANAGSYLSSQLGDGAPGAPPRAAFAWFANDTVAEFRDLSSSGGAGIADRTWEFGDGQSAGERDPSHTYASPGDYFVRLTVRDADGLEAVAATQVSVVAGGSNGGVSETAPTFDLDLGNILLPVAIAVLVVGLYVVSALVGGSLVKAGWNLIRPRPETIRIRLKPRHLEVAGAEAVLAGTPAATPPPRQE